MTEPLITVETVIDADPSQVWTTLTQSPSPMFLGADVVSDWHKGSPLNMSGEFHGRQFHDHGEIRESEPGRRLAFTHFSGSQEGGGNLVDIRLEPQGERTRVTLSQAPLDGAHPDPAKIAEFRKNWEMMLGSLKKATDAKALEEA
jgi:uncharacterized protein YndB with AHSA1/START domain